MSVCRSWFVSIVLFITAVNTFAQIPKSESDFKKYFIAHSDSLDAVEGLWTVNTSQESYSHDTLYDSKSYTQTVAIIKEDSIFRSYDMKGAQFNIHFNKTAVNKVYLFKIYFKETDTYTNANAVISAGRKMQYSYEFPDDYLRLIFKDTYEQGDRVVNKATWTKIYPE